MRFFAKSVAVLAAVLGASAAHAAVFDFSFSNVDGGTPGTVQGEIFLPDGNGTFAASSILVNSAPAALGYTPPFDVVTAMPIVVANSFTVSGGNITGYSYASQNSSEAFTLNYSTFGSLLSVKGSASTSTGVLDVANSTVSFSSSAVPEPSSWLLMLIGFGAIGMAARRRSGASVPAAQIPASAVLA